MCALSVHSWWNQDLGEKDSFKRLSFCEKTWNDNKEAFVAGSFEPETYERKTVHSMYSKQSHSRGISFSYWASRTLKHRIFLKNWGDSKLVFKCWPPNNSLVLKPNSHRLFLGELLVVILLGASSGVDPTRVARQRIHQALLY